MGYGKKKPARKAAPKMTVGGATRQARRFMKNGGATPAQMDMIMKMLGKKPAAKKMYGGPNKSKPTLKRGGKTRK